MSRLIVSLTSISSRVNELHHVLHSLLTQKTNANYKVHLYISKEPFMLDQGIKTLTTALKKLESKFPNLLSIIFVKNNGSYRKIIPVLKNYYSGSLDIDYIITADDDTIYPSTWLEGLLSGIETNNCVVGYRGRQIQVENNELTPYRTWSHSSDHLLNKSLLTVSTGKDGIIYKPSFFHPNVTNIDDALKICGHADDLWLKVHTVILGIPSLLLSASLKKQFEDLGLHRNDNITLYQKYNKFGGNDIAMNHLVDYCMEKLGINLIHVFEENMNENSTWFSEKFLMSFWNKI